MASRPPRRPHHRRDDDADPGDFDRVYRAVKDHATAEEVRDAIEACA
jgi:hypothetical protein